MENAKNFDELSAKEKSLVVAKKIADMYFDKFKEVISEFKLHTLMYLSQRESLIRDPNKPLLTENFYAYQFGPGLKSIRNEYKNLIKSYEGINKT